MELNKKQNSKLLFAKKDYLSKVLDYFMTEQEKENTTIFKLINELHAKKIITTDMQKLLQYAVINYQFKIVDILAECEELHIRLYDNADKHYNKKSKCFYKNM